MVSRAVQSKSLLNGLQWLWPWHCIHNNAFSGGTNRERERVCPVLPFGRGMFLVVNIVLFLPPGAFICPLRWALNAQLNVFTPPALRPVCSSTAFTTPISLQQDWECEIFTCSTAAADLWVERFGAREVTRSKRCWKLRYSPATLRGFISKHTLWSLCLCMFRFCLPSSVLLLPGISFMLYPSEVINKTHRWPSRLKKNKDKFHSLLFFHFHLKWILSSFHYRACSEKLDTKNMIH